MAIEAVIQTTIREAEVVLQSPFYIPMTGPAARPRRSLKHDDTFIVLDSHGDIGASAGGPDGLFNADTRYLARLELVLEDVQPLLLGSNLRDSPERPCTRCAVVRWPRCARCRLRNITAASMRRRCSCCW
jgi:hypothetical protein